VSQQELSAKVFTIQDHPLKPTFLFNTDLSIFHPSATDSPGDKPFLPFHHEGNSLIA